MLTFHESIYRIEHLFFVHLFMAKNIQFFIWTFFYSSFHIILFYGNLVSQYNPNSNKNISKNQSDLLSCMCSQINFWSISLCFVLVCTPRIQLYFSLLFTASKKKRLYISFVLRYSFCCVLICELHTEGNYSHVAIC